MPEQAVTRDWLQIVGSCEGCPKVAEFQQQSDEFAQNPSPMVGVKVGEEVRVWVASRSLMDLPWDLELLQTGIEISRQLAGNQDALRCAGGCAINVDFRTVLGAVRRANRDDFNRRMQFHISARDVYESLPVIDPQPKTEEELLADFIADIFAETRPSREQTGTVTWTLPDGSASSAMVRVAQDLHSKDVVA